MTNGILQNGNTSNDAKSGNGTFDRSIVLENTEHNAQLGSAGEAIRRSLAAAHGGTSNGSELERHPSFKADTPAPHHKKYPKTKAPSAADPIHWDEKGIHEHDLERGQTEKIDEPNTPYMGTAADTEYYDRDDPVPEDLDLGETA